MIPYFFALIVIGLPTMLVEWAIGRYGGAHGHGTVGPMVYIQARKAISRKSNYIRFCMRSNRFWGNCISKFILYTYHRLVIRICS